MPKINAPTVREHHERVLTSLIDAAEQVLRYEGPDQFTTSAVSARAGVARNSIYRYVDSVDDLRGLVVERYMPAWFRAVQEAMDATSDPAQQIVAWALTNLEQATIAGHGWLMKVGDKRLNQQAAGTVNQAHQNMFAGRMGADLRAQCAPGCGHDRGTVELLHEAGGGRHGLP